MTYKGYADKESRKNYLKEYMRDRRAEEKEESNLRLAELKEKLRANDMELLSKLSAFYEQHPEYQQLSQEDKQKFKDSLKNIMESSTDKLMEFRREVEVQWPVVLRKIMRDAYEKVEKERKEFIEAELHRMFAPILDLPYEQRVRALEGLLEHFRKLQKTKIETVSPEVLKHE